MWIVCERAKWYLSALSYFLAWVLFFVFGHPQELRVQQAKKMSKLRLFQHSRQVHHKRGKGVLPQKTVSISMGAAEFFLRSVLSRHRFSVIPEATQVWQKIARRLFWWWVSLIPWGTYLLKYEQCILIYIEYVPLTYMKIMTTLNHIWNTSVDWISGAKLSKSERCGLWCWPAAAVGAHPWAVVGVPEGVIHPTCGSRAV